MKVFISYAHEDEDFLKELLKHLKILEREKLITSWYDRKILAGFDIDEEILQNLEDSQIILFLISPDFMASDYVQSVEVQRANQLMENGRSLLIPIIIRQSHWEGIPFSRKNALPRDGKPIKHWDDADDAWYNIIEELTKLINTINQKNGVEELLIDDGKYELQSNFKEWLESTNVQFQHRHKEKIYLSDLYIFPDLKRFSEKIEELDTFSNSQTLLDEKKYYCIIGDDQSGKTALCKQYFSHHINNGDIPIFVNGETISSTNIVQLLRKSLIEQYHSTDVVNYLSNENKILIIDDFDKLKLNRKFREKLVSILINNFNCIYILVSNNFYVEQYDLQYFEKFDIYNILQFGHLKTTELIEKWVVLGREKTIEDNVLYQEIDQINLHVNTFVKKNIVPPKPLFILSIIQVLETMTPSRLEMTAYGDCYQFLIQNALNKLRIKSRELDKYFNYLTELANFLFIKSTKIITIEELKEFRSYYSDTFIKVDHSVIISNLIKINVICETVEGYSFSYKYIYYFYVARYISEHINEVDSVKEMFNNILKNLHIEENGNIIVFITHHTKNQYVLDKIQNEINKIYEKQPSTSLSIKELKYLQDFIDEIPKLVIEKRDVETERRNKQISLDQLNNHNNINDNGNDDVEIEELTKNIFIEINKTFRGIEIIGQIIRNRYGSFSKHKLIDMTNHAYGLSFRFLDFFIKISDKFKNEILDFIEDLLKEHPSITNAQIEKDAKKFYLLLTYGLIFSILMKTSYSLGTMDTIEINKKISEVDKTPSSILLYASIHLLFSKKISITILKDLYEKLDGNPVVQRIFQEFIVQHIYMYKISSKNIQKISSHFNIPIMTQRLLIAKKPTKK